MGKEAQDFAVSLSLQGLAYTEHGHIAHFPRALLRGIFQEQDWQGKSRTTIRKEATHSWIVASESWSQVKEASENCTALSVEKKALSFSPMAIPMCLSALLSSHMSIFASFRGS